MLTQSRAAIYYSRMSRSAELMSVGTNREEMQFREPEIRDSSQILYMASRAQPLKSSPTPDQVPPGPTFQGSHDWRRNTCLWFFHLHPSLLWAHQPSFPLAAARARTPWSIPAVEAERLAVSPARTTKRGNVQGTLSEYEPIKRADHGSGF
ncbi:hypothetical protein IQ07DRAFT_212050 [Pyrenochaeta sp. DS3sAY3a]|nr:hypothetical protein IQ07DRAFT_212050 [Pyrenochaeta sp. DS3sAY3a]